MFNEDGTGISIGRSKTMNTSNTNVGVSIVSISEFSTPFTSVVNDDDTVEINFGVATATILLGSGAGDTVTVSGRLARAQIADGGKIILSGPAVAIEEETLHFNVPNDGAFAQVRLCTRSSTAAKLRREGDDDR
jgi:hypothetical protein